MKATSRLIAAMTLAFIAICVKAGTPTNERWQQCVLAAIDSFPQHGGYYTGGRPNQDFSKTTLQALNEAYHMRLADQRPQFNPHKAQPSFCSSATYAVLVKALLMWDTDGKIPRAAWLNIKPYVGIVDYINDKGIGEDDGFGFWGRANANGPGVAVLVHELKAGYSITAYRGAKSEKNKEKPGERYLTDEEWNANPVWQQAVPGDIMKIFWNRNETSGSDSGAIIGCHDVKTDDQERGHSVVFLGYEPNGDIRYWSSNGPGKNNKELGYSVATCPRTRVQRVVFTRITQPERFANASKMPPTSENKYLSGLNGKRHSTTAEMKKMIGAK